MSVKNSSDTTWNRVLDLPVRTAVRQPTAPARAAARKELQQICIKKLGATRRNLIVCPCPTALVYLFSHYFSLNSNISTLSLTAF